MPRRPSANRLLMEAWWKFQEEVGAKLTKNDILLEVAVGLPGFRRWADGEAPIGSFLAELEQEIERRL